MSINTNDATTTCKNIKKQNDATQNRIQKTMSAQGIWDNIRGVNNINIVLYKEGCVACIHSCCHQI